MAKIEHLTHTPLSPQVALARTLEKVDDIASVAIVIKWRDGTFAVDYSSQTVETLAASQMALDECTRAAMRSVAARSLSHPQSPEFAS